MNYVNSQYGIALITPTTVDTSDPPGLGHIGWVTIGDRLRFVIALDRSYSMSAANKETLAKEGASLFVELCKQNVGESIAVVSFSNTAVSNFAMHDVTTSPDTKTAAINAINAIGLENMTALGDGLRQSLKEITGSGTVSPDASAVEAVVLLSDGVNNYGAETPAAVLPDLRGRGVRVFTIGLGNPADPVYPLDESTLLDISNQTGALYTHALNAADLQTIYTTYAAEIRGMDVYPEAGGALERGATREHKVIVDNFTKEETFVLHWPSGAGAYQLQLRDPAGTVITPPAPGVENVVRRLHSFYRIRKPKPGTWTMIVKNIKGEGRISYTTQALALAPGLSCKVAPRQPFYKPGETAIIRAFVSAGGIPVANALVSGTITGPDGTKAAVQLADDGNWKAHGDEKANDGVYATRFTSTQVRGTYQISLVIRNVDGITATPDEIDPRWKPQRIPPFVRAAKNSFSVGRLQVKPPQTEKQR